MLRFGKLLIRKVPRERGVLTRDSQQIAGVNRILLASDRAGVFVPLVRQLSQPARLSHGLRLSLLLHCWRKIASLTMWIPVKHFLSVLLRALRRARHFALVEGSAIPT